MKFDTVKAIWSVYWAFVVVSILGVIGWAMNIIKIVGAFGGDITAMLIARLVGVLAFPLGAVLGFF